MPINNVLPPKTISEWLLHATREFTKANIPSPRLDAEVLLCHMLGVDRTWLIAHADDSLTLAALSQKGGTRRSGLKEYGEKLMIQRMKRIPIAYLVGAKEFYGREFIVTPDVLVPRPETETLIELLREIVPTMDDQKICLLDVGTGSGIIGITAKLELPSLEITLSDISPEALGIARKNASRLKAKPIRYEESDLLGHWLSHDNPQQFDIITANLPYVDRSWDRSPETKHEPMIALFADDEGLEYIVKLIDQSVSLISPHGYLVLEADPIQHAKIIKQAQANGFRLHESREYIVALQKV